MRCAVVGLGHSAEKILLPSLRALRLEVVAGCDPDPRARERATRVGILRTFEHAEALLDAVKPDLVVVATPPDTHRDLCLLGLQAGAHVFCEKPFAPSVPDVDAVLDAAARAGRQVAVNNQYYQMPIFTKTKEALGRPDVGALVFLQLWQTTLEPESRYTGWTGRLKRRTLFEFGAHAVQLAQYLFSEDPAAVTCALASDATGRLADAVVSLTLHFSRGQIASLVLNRISRGRWRYLDIRVETERTTLRASLGGEARLTAGIDGLARVPFLSLRLTRGGLAWIETGERRQTFATNPPNCFTLATRDHLAAFVSAIHAGRPFEYGALQNRAVIETIAAAYLSAELGRRVDLVDDRAAIAKVAMA